MCAILDKMRFCCGELWSPLNLSSICSKYTYYIAYTNKKGQVDRKRQERRTTGWCGASQKKGAEEIRSFECSGNSFLLTLMERNRNRWNEKKIGNKKSAYRRQSVLCRSLWKQDNTKMAVSVDHGSQKSHFHLSEYFLSLIAFPHPPSPPCLCSSSLCICIMSFPATKLVSFLNARSLTVAKIDLILKSQQ